MLRIKLKIFLVHCSGTESYIIITKMCFLIFDISRWEPFGVLVQCKATIKDVEDIPDMEGDGALGDP